MGEARSYNGFGFTTAVRVRVRRLMSREEADTLALRLLTLIDSGRDIDPDFAGVDVRYVDTKVDGDRLLIPIPIRTTRAQDHHGRLRVALGVISLLIQHIGELPDIMSIEDDAAPSIATVGF